MEWPAPREVIPDQLADYLVATVATSDRSGRFPDNHVSRLRQSGFLRYEADRSTDCLEKRIGALAALAELCPSSAFVVHMHQSVHWFITALTRAVNPNWLATTVAASSQPMFCSANSEPGVHYKRTAVRSTFFRREGDTVRLQGRKHFCSGVGLADYIFSLATDENTGAPAAVVYPKRAPGVSIVGEWDSLGLRATDSRSLELDVTLSSDSVLPVTEPLAVEYWSLGYSAISYGIGKAVIRDIVGLQEALRQSGRWGDWELHELGRVHYAERAAASLLEAAVQQFHSADRKQAVVLARAAASQYAISACSFGLEVIGGEAVLFESPWSRRFRDAVTMGLLPPSTGRRLKLLGLGILGQDPPLLETSATQVATGGNTEA